MVDILNSPIWSTSSCFAAGVFPLGLAKHLQRAVVHKHLVLGSTAIGYLVNTWDPEMIFLGDFEDFWLRLFSCHHHCTAQLYCFSLVGVFYFVQILVLEKNPAWWASVCASGWSVLLWGQLERKGMGAFLDDSKWSWWAWLGNWVWSVSVSACLGGSKVGFLLVALLVLLWSLLMWQVGLGSEDPVLHPLLLSGQQRCHWVTRDVVQALW